MKILIGLGNPGSKYNETRHNIGFTIIDSFANAYSFPTWKKQFDAYISTHTLSYIDPTTKTTKSEKVAIAKPQTFMNLSGKTVQALKTFYKSPSEDVIVIHDELSLPFGTVRCKRNGGHAGHNGLRDISSRIGSEYHRLRFGINRPPEGWDTANYVLAKWNKDEQTSLQTYVDHSIDMLYSWCFEGIDITMNRFHQ